jgi:hypothetical protein
MVYLNENECDFVGYSEAKRRKITRLATEIERAAKQLSKMGIQIFAGGSSTTLRYLDEKHTEGYGAVIIGGISGGCWDGGDGGSENDGEGILRGEGHRWWYN